MVFSKRFKVLFILLSIFYVAMGIALLAWTTYVISILRFLIGGFLIAYGALRLVRYFSRKQRGRATFGFGLILGIITLALGVLVLFNPRTMLAFPIIIGLSIVVDSVMKLQMAVDLKRSGDRLWWLTLLFALIALGLGAMIILNPANFGKDFLVLIIAISMIFDGAINLWAYGSMSRLANPDEDLAKQPKQTPPSSPPSSPPMT